MRALVDLEQEQLRKLDRIAKAQQRSRAALIRDAVASYVEKNARETADDAFGLWRGRSLDGLAYQEKVRSEW